jgi:hypothetical protein
MAAMVFFFPLPPPCGWIGYVRFRGGSIFIVSRPPVGGGRTVRRKVRRPFFSLSPVLRAVVGGGGGDGDGGNEPPYYFVFLFPFFSPFHCSLILWTTVSTLYTQCVHRIRIHNHIIAPPLHQFGGRLVGKRDAPPSVAARPPPVFAVARRRRRRRRRRCKVVNRCQGLPRDEGTESLLSVSPDRRERRGQG